MPPEWDFGGDDAKRRAFIEWVWAELDRFAVMASAQDEMPPTEGDWLELLRPGMAVPVGKGVGRPKDDFAGMNAMVWEFGLLRFMFGRYWPNRKRRLVDPASAASIAVERCQRALPADQRVGGRAEARLDLARRVFEEWERGSRSPGRVQAERDIAYLETLPPHRFAR